MSDKWPFGEPSVPWFLVKRESVFESEAAGVPPEEPYPTGSPKQPGYSNKGAGYAERDAGYGSSDG